MVPIVLPLEEWGDRHLQPDGAYTAVRHRRCGQRVQVVAHCPRCRETVALPGLQTDFLRPLPT